MPAQGKLCLVCAGMVQKSCYSRSMSEMLPLPHAPQPAKFRHRKHAKALFIIAALEVLAIIALLVWVIAIRPDNKQPAQSTGTQQTPTDKTLGEPKLALKPVASGFESPVGIRALPDPTDKRLFVVEQTGAIHVIAANGTVEQAPFLDLTAKVKTGGEMGLLGLAFHPKVAENSYFFVNYIDKQLNTIVARYSISKQTGRADPASEKVLLKLKQPFENHNGGDLAFGPDGYLYIGLGDGGSGGDPGNHAQTVTDLLGKMLRIDVDRGNPYSVPSDNPLAKSGSSKSEVWALGLRNPWRFSFDRQTGDLYIADVGQGDWEEINFQTAGSAGGVNYGWRCYEGMHPFQTAGCQDASAYTSPVIEYDHSLNRCSVTGGYVYRGATYPALAGKYFYGDFCSGHLYYTGGVKASWAQVTALESGMAISTFGEDSSGELYVADYSSGTIYQITDTAN
jgi:glucose/arabinose dehydrogenase